MIELSLKYYSLFKLSAFHSFYSKESKSGVTIVPAANTIQKAKSLGLILKKSGEEYFALYDGDKIEGLINEFSIPYQALKFTFFIFSSEPYFINLTDLPLEDGNSMFYFSNAHSTTEDNTVKLHRGSFAGKTDRYKVVTSYKVDTTIEKGIELRDGLDNIIFKGEVKQNENLTFSNKNLPVGKYEIWEAGKLIDSFILFSDIPAAKPIGIIDIFFTDQLKEEILEGITTFNIPSYKLEINFSARSTYWKYLLVGKYNLNLEHTQIESTDKKYSFSGPIETLMKNGLKAYVFISESPIPLKQVYDFGLQLKSNRNGISNGKIIMEHLPLASPEIVKPESRDQNSKIFSEIIVHL